MLATSCNGIGAMALGSMIAGESQAHTQGITGNTGRKKAKHCIFLFMQGGVSQMDSFEYKPALNKLHGKQLPKIDNINGELQGRLSFPHAVVGSPFKFKRYGESGKYVSELLPKIAGQVDDLAFVHGIETDNQNHGPSTLHVTTGSQFPGSPSVGSWISYGLGTPNENMPSYVVIQDPRGAPVNGAAIWANGYLPARHQGCLFRSKGSPILNLKRSADWTRKEQREELKLLHYLNQQHANERVDTNLEARIKAYELAFRMQTEAPEIIDIGDESQATRKLYGLDQGHTSGFGTQCLLARRLVEKGVRFTLLVHGVQIGSHSWDDHGDVKGGMIRHCREVDQPVAALLSDLKQRGLLEDTLVVWASEMGRTPFRNGGLGNKPGREHNSKALTMWFAGGNSKGGAVAGETDDFSLRSAGESISIRDVHATLLDLMGLDDEKLRFLYAGRNRQLTDIGGTVPSEIIS